MKRSFVIIFSVLLLAIPLWVYGYYVFIPNRILSDAPKILKQVWGDDLSFSHSSVKNGTVILHDVTLSKNALQSIETLSIHFSIHSFLRSPLHPFVVSIKNGGFILDDRNNIVHKINNVTDIPFVSNTIIVDSSVITHDQDIGVITLNIDSAAIKRKQRSFEFSGQASVRQQGLSTTATLKGILDTEKLFIDINATATDYKNKAFAVRRAVAVGTFEISKFNETTLLLDIIAPSANYLNLPFRNVKTQIKQEGNTSWLTINGETHGNQNIPWSLEQKNGTQHTKITINPDHVKDIFSFLNDNNIIGFYGASSLPFSPYIKSKPQINLTFTKTSKERFNGKFSIDHNLDIKNIEKEIHGSFSMKKNKGLIHGLIQTKPIKIKMNDNYTLLSFDLKNDGTFIIDTREETPRIAWKIDAHIQNSVFQFGNLILYGVHDIWKFASDAIATVPEIQFYVPLKKAIQQAGSFKINIANNDNNIVRELVYHIFNGKVILQPTPQKRNSHAFIFSDISIQKFLSAFNIGGSVISGRIGGNIPVTIKDGSLIANQALLQSQDHGILMLTEETAFLLFPGSDEESHKKRQALTNFLYDFFEIRFDGDLSQSTILTINMRGYSEKIDNGDMPIDISFQTEIHISQLLSHIE